MRTLANYEKLLSDNPMVSVNLMLAADMIWAAKHGFINRNDAHSSDEWGDLARYLKNRYGEELSASEVRHEMSSVLKKE